MECFFKRLEKYIKVRPTAALMDVIVKIMVEVLSILGIVTKEIGQGKLSTSFRFDISPTVDLRAEKFFKKLAGMKDVEDALQRLDKLTQEESLMAVVEALTITREIDDKVEGVDHKVSDLKRSSSSNLVTADRESLTSLSGNESRKDFRKWVAAPDPSIKFPHCVRCSSRGYRGLVHQRQCRRNVENIWLLVMDSRKT
jgi:hypothetical protein